MSTAAVGSLRRFAPRFWCATAVAWLGLGPGFQAIPGETVSGGSYTLVGGPVAGGGVVTGGAFTLDAGAGDVAPGLFRGGAFEVRGSLYDTVESVTVGDVTLTIRDVGDGRVVLDWPAAAVGYVLESAAALDEPTRWQPVVPAPGANTLATPAEEPLRYYRLRKP